MKKNNNTNVAKSLSSDFSSSGQDRKKMNTDSESALKTAKMPLEHFWDHYSMQFLILKTFLQAKMSLKSF